MIDFLRRCLLDILGSFLLWVPVCLIIIILLDFVLFSWIKRRLRKRSLSRSWRAPLIWATAVIIQIIIVPLITFSGALLFSIERGTATALEKGSPVVINSYMSIGEKYVTEQMGILNNETIVDISHLHSVLELSSSSAATKYQASLSLLSSIPAISRNYYIDSLRHTANALLSGVDRITWGSLIKTTGQQIRSAFVSKSYLMAQSLRISSLTHASFFIIAAFISTLLTISTVLLLSVERD